MRKSIKLLVACMLCSPVAIVAQEQDSLFARKSKVAIEYGRGISFNLKESTTATAEQVRRNFRIRKASITLICFMA